MAAWGSPQTLLVLPRGDLALAGVPIRSRRSLRAFLYLHYGPAVGRSPGFWIGMLSASSTAILAFIFWGERLTSLQWFAGVTMVVGAVLLLRTQRKKSPATYNFEVSGVESAESSANLRVWLGTCCCLLSALCYSGANICLRQLSELGADAAWVICIKETVSVTVVGPWLLWQVLRGRISVRWRAIMVLILAGLAVQLIGNLGMQWAFGVIGLAICMTAVFAVMLSGSGLIDVVVFRESLPLRSILAIGMVVASVALLSIGATRYSQSTDPQAVTVSVAWMLLGLGAACLTGFMFASLGAAIRYAGTFQTPVIVTVVLVTGTGMVSLGTLSLFRLGPEGMLDTTGTEWGWMISSGVFNLVGFALISKGLKLTTLVHANVLNASQVALGALAGVLLFHEPCNAWLLVGILLTIAGIASFGQPQPKREVGSDHHLAKYQQ